MTDIKQMQQRALALLNEVRAEYPLVSSEVASNLALCRAIEQHDAFRQEVSDAVEQHYNAAFIKPVGPLARFIIAKPDPLVEALIDCGLDPSEGWPDEIRAAIEKRGGKIVWGEG
jgi:hypothetical protein